MHSLSAFASNVTSQFGEDGILAEIFRRIGAPRRSCVEFGAWDGKYLSNTWALWHEQGWRAVLIEGDRGRHDALARSLGGFPQVTPVCAYVQPEGENSLDNLLARQGLDEDFDLLSIDVDGEDYHIWRGLSRRRPRVVAIEYNPTIPPELELVQRKGEYFGASARALVSLARAKGYRLACCTKTNCIFVGEKDWPALQLEEPRLEDVFPRGHLTYVINAFDGRTYLNRKPTYTSDLPTLSPTPLLRELRESLGQGVACADTPTEPGEPLSQVRIFALPEHAPQGGLGRRVLRRAWGIFLWSPVGGPVRLLRERWLRWRANRAALSAWERQGRPVPPPHAFKQKVVLQYARQFDLRVLVETGTYLGEMVDAMRTAFGRVYSIELDQELYWRAVQRFAGRGSVTIVQGDSSKVLPQLLAELAEPVLFWLDGHYSAGVTAKGTRTRRS